MEHQAFLVTEVQPALVYDALVATLAPRPVTVLITLNEDGSVNAAPYSFVMPGGSNPPSVVFSATLNESGEPKTSLVNAQRHGQFVLCGLSKDALIKWVNGEVNGRTQSGFVPSRVVDVPTMEAAEYALECHFAKIVSHGEGPYAARYVIGEVVAIKLVENAIMDGNIQPQAVQSVYRLGGAQYFDPKSGAPFSLD